MPVGSPRAGVVVHFSRGRVGYRGAERRCAGRRAWRTAYLAHDDQGLQGPPGVPSPRICRPPGGSTATRRCVVAAVAADRTLTAPCASAAPRRFDNACPFFAAQPPVTERYSHHYEFFSNLFAYTANLLAKTTSFQLKIYFGMHTVSRQRLITIFRRPRKTWSFATA